MFLFVILFGLSMDYHVFILAGSARHTTAGCRPTTRSARDQVDRRRGTSAAIVMVGVFAIFGSLDFLLLKQMGVGLAAAVLIDATIIRAVLLPATMKLLGDATGTCRSGSTGCRACGTRSRRSPSRRSRLD